MRAVNLLTPELRTAQKGSGAPRPPAAETAGGIGAFALLGALALCVAAVAAYVLSGNVIKDRTASLAAVSAANDATVKRAAELKPYADFQTVANDRVSTVQALAGARFDWEQSLRDLSRALPSNVYISSMNGDVGSSASGGGSGIRSAISAPAIELAGCTRSQPDVAILMSRLRNIQGVTRVSLSKSEKADVAAAGGELAMPCGNHAPPTFNVVVFFEKATVGAALADVTKEVKPGAAAAAAATPTGGKDGKAAATPAATEGAKP
jgi:Tfp pilus assembly protein PilN